MLGPIPFGVWSSGRHSRFRRTAAARHPVDLAPGQQAVVDHVVHPTRRTEGGGDRVGRVVDPNERLVAVGQPQLGREPEARGAHLHSRIVARDVVEPTKAQNHASATRLDESRGVGLGRLDAGAEVVTEQRAVLVEEALAPVGVSERERFLHEKARAGGQPRVDEVATRLAAQTLVLGPRRIPGRLATAAGCASPG